MRPIPAIAVVNLSSLDRGTVLYMVEAVRRQLLEHVAPVWGRIAPEVDLHDRLETVPPWVPPIILFDHAWTADALGYHTETPDGRPFARVFLDGVLADGGVVLYDGPRLTIASVVSHEAIEMMIDPDCNLWVDGPPSGRSYALEICDPVNGDTYPVPAGDGTLVGVSSFVYPGWFDAEGGGGPFDHLGLLQLPFSLRAQGHALVRSAPGTEAMLGAPALPSLRRFAALRFPAARTMRRVTGTGFRPRRRHAGRRW